MADRIEFTSNYNDLSTQQGFQFEFKCDRCGNGYRSKFVPSVTGTVSGVLDAASSLLGGFFSSASDLSGRVNSAAWQRAHDDAFMKAVDELKGDFVQCPKCTAWVCRKSCWNNSRGLCKNCAPDLAVEMSAAQAQKTVSDVYTNAATSVEDSKVIAPENFRESVKASCPQCGVALAGSLKFCPECGYKLQTAAHCTECGAKLPPAAKFCQECGHKAAA